jgi:DNA repair protein RecO (recombination protein O)
MIKTRAIVLHRFPYSDSSFIVKVLTEESGIVSFIVKGGKKKESPFRGALDPLALSEVVFRQNPNTELQFIKEATLLDWHKDLRNDLLSLAKAQVITEMILRYAPQGVPLQEEFERLEQSLKEFNETCGSSTNAPNAATSSSKQNAEQNATTSASEIATSASAPATSADSPSTNSATSVNASATSANTVATPLAPHKSNIFARWLLDTCDMWGYNLDLDTCCRCGHTLDKPAADFFPETGGFICHACLGVETPRARTETLQGLWALRNGDKIEHPEFTENALLAYLRHHIGFLKEIHSIKFLNETRKLFGK